MILQNYIPDLFDLVWFPLPIFRLQVEDFFNIYLGENVMIASNAFIKSKPFE
jgi:hypothetical protein